MKYLVVQVTPTHLQCVGIFASETDAARCAAIWNELEGVLNPPEKVHYKMLAVDMP